MWHPAFQLHKLIARSFNHISEELEPNQRFVSGQIGTYVLFISNYVKYNAYFNESSFAKFIRHFSLQC